MPPKKGKKKTKATRPKRTKVYRGGERILTEEELMREAMNGLTTQNPYAPPPAPAPMPQYIQDNRYYLQPNQFYKWIAPPVLNAVQGKWQDAWDLAKHQFKGFVDAHKQAKTVSTSLAKMGLRGLSDWTRKKGWGKKKAKKKKS